MTMPQQNQGDGKQSSPKPEQQSKITRPFGLMKKPGQLPGVFGGHPAKRCRVNSH
jgi:hypothetical protein